MPEQIIFDNFPLGWCPSYGPQSDFSSPSQALLRMDNLTLDSKGEVRLANRSTASGTVPNSVNSIYGALMASLKYRYAYTSLGSLLRNYGGAASLTTFDEVLGAGATSQKAAFLTALGHTICLAGALQIKDRGDINWPLTIPTPVAPALSNQAALTVDLDNFDGSGNMTNWSATAGSSFVNTGTDITINSTAGGLASFQTVFSSVVDTTNFGVTREDTPNDIFTFNLALADASAFTEMFVEMLLQSPSTVPLTDEYSVLLSQANIVGAANLSNTIPMPQLQDGILVSVPILRSQFIRSGTNNALDWNTVKAVRITLYLTSGAVSTTGITFSNIVCNTGVVSSQQTYVAVEFNNTGQFIQYSIASTQVSVNGGGGYFILVDRSGVACNAQCNGISFFRNNGTLGQFLLIATQTGAYGFTPASFVDSISDDTALENAAVSPTPNVLQFYRTDLPANIIGAIYFASRVIYLTTGSFFPSFQLDLGTYDSRFTYELNSTNSERCLFLTPLSIGTFIVATTVDFYQVTGTFNLISTANADGTVTTVQDVTIQKLGISDPAVNSSFMEVEGNILYMSATGLRQMSNGVSSLMNTTIDLLFRNENRYGFPPVSLQPNDTSLIGLVSSGTRIYCALPFSNGANAILVSTYNPPLPADLRGANYWRPMLIAAQCLSKEQDGTVIYGDSVGDIATLETSFTGTFPIYLQTQWQFGQHPTETKSLGSLLMYLNTGGSPLTVQVLGLKENGTVLTYTTTVTTASLSEVQVDPHAALPDCLAYQLILSGTLLQFELEYAILVTVQEYPPITFYALIPFSNLGKDTLKKLAKWGFVVDTLGGSVTATVTADNTVIASEIDHSAEPQGISTEYWYNNIDVAALDWQLELTAPTGMHFFKFMSPDILQVFPPGRMLDQFGPLDLDMEGIVFGMRVRLYNTGPTVTYEVLDNDSLVYTNSVSTPVNSDSTFIEKFPKGINTSVCRILISSPTPFYRFSVEVLVRTTGKETDNKWVKLGTK